jgi:arylsulfatase A-like enzyme
LLAVGIREPHSLVGDAVDIRRAIAAFIGGQSVYRTGMSKVGVPGADIGWVAEDPTIAELLKPLGYATGQIGKNHFGDLNKYLPTVHPDAPAPG